MEHSEHDLKGRLMHFLMHVYGNATAVVDHLYGIVCKNRDLDMGGIACKGLVD